MPLAGDIQKRAVAQRERAHYADVRDLTSHEQWAPFSKCKIKNPRRRNRCRDSLEAFLKTYFEEAFYCDFGPDHLRLIESTERVCAEGGRVIAVLPRGSGKTTIFQMSILHSVLYSKSRFAVLATSDDNQATTLMDGIRMTLESNELLFQDFPEVCLPIRALEGVSVRCQYQLYEGKRTQVQFSKNRIRFGTIPQSTKRGNAGAIIRCGGLTSALRGLVVTNPDGSQIRPDFILVDDPQTKTSARSPSQVQQREDIINGDLAHMAGVGKKISIMCAATVIEQDDLACRLLDKERSPDWISYRVPMLYSMPSNMELWDEYADIRHQEAIHEIESGSANNFYTENREKMDDGARHYWEERIDPGRISAIQSAMDKYYQSPRAFASEMQNEPEASGDGDLEPLLSTDLVRRMHPFGRGKVPMDVTTITAHIDVQLNILYWMVIGWNQAFKGYVLDYGCYPEQSRRNFDLKALSSAKHMKSLQRATPGVDDDAAIAAGVERTVRSLIDVEFDQMGSPRRIDRGLVDARYKPEAVERGIMAVGQSIFMPSYGVGIGAKNRAMSRWVRKTGAYHGHNWIAQRPEKRYLRSIFIDTNYWKSQAYGALKVPKEHSEAITFFKSKYQSYHQMVADHCASERVVRVDANGRIVDEWELPPHRPDNHHWDNLVSCMAAASVMGISKHDDRPRKVTTKEDKPKKKRAKKLA